MFERLSVKKITGRINLTGLLEDGSPANNRQSKDVVCFVTPDNKYKLVVFRPADVDMLYLSGPGASELFVKDSKYGYFKGNIRNKEVNIVINKISGEIRFISHVPGPYSFDTKRCQEYR